MPLVDGRPTAGELVSMMRARIDTVALVPVGPTPTPIGDRLAEWSQGNAMATYRADRHTPEFDPYTEFSRRDLRRLTSARYLTATGERPDVMADLLWKAGGDQVTDDPVAWYLTEALRALAERRAARNRDRHIAVARRNGHQTYYQHRNEYARSLGYGSLWDMRRRKKWT